MEQLSMKVLGKMISEYTKVYEKSFSTQEPHGFSRWEAQILDTMKVNILSLDHDLGDEKFKTGYDVCKHIVEYNLWLKTIYLHTVNPVGRQNMSQLLNRYKPEVVKVYNSPILTKLEELQNE